VSENLNARVTSDGAGIAGGIESRTTDHRARILFKMSDLSAEIVETMISAIESIRSTGRPVRAEELRL
jgi:hypothetical protein